MKRNTVVNIEYASAQALYWMKYAASISFATVYLKTLAFTNTGIGIVFGLGYVLGFVVSNLLGNWIDRFEKINASGMITACLGMETAMLLYIMLFGGKNTVTVIVYGLHICMCMCVGGLLTKQWVDLSHWGYSVNFGVTRAIGSLGYTAMAALLGIVVERSGVRVVFPVAIATVAAEEAVNILLSCKRDMLRGTDRAFVRGEPLFVFIRNNGLFCLLLAGLMLIFFGHKVPNDYMINVVTDVGGNAADMGLLHAFTAAVEIPVMVFYNRIPARFKKKTLLTIALFAFTLKALSLTLAPSMPWIYAASVLQSASFALYTPAIVDYVNEVVSYENSAKGQTMVASMVVLGSVFSSLFGGILLDRITVKQTLLITMFISAAGATLCILALVAQEKKKEKTA